MIYFRINMIAAILTLFAAQLVYARDTTPLIEAVKSGDTEAVDALLSMGASINAYDSGKSTALMWTAIIGNGKIAAKLIKAGASLEFRDEGGNTPLMRAAYGGHIDIVKMLVAAGANINARANNGRSALDYAQLQRRHEVVAFLEPINGE